VVGTRNGKIMKVLFDKNETSTKVLFEINISGKNQKPTMN
jgi:hypothetical protein